MQSSLFFVDVFIGEFLCKGLKKYNIIALTVLNICNSVSTTNSILIGKIYLRFEPTKIYVYKYFKKIDILLWQVKGRFDNAQVHRYCLFSKLLSLAPPLKKANLTSSFSLSMNRQKVDKTKITTNVILINFCYLELEKYKYWNNFSPNWI